MVLSEQNYKDYSMDPKNLNRANELFEEKRQLLEMRQFISSRKPGEVGVSVYDARSSGTESKEIESDKLVPYLEKALYERLTDITKEVAAL